MSKIDKTLEKILLGASDANIHFDDLRKLLDSLGFSVRTKGSHHIFTRHDLEEIMNIQPKGSNAKAYQVKQVRNIILKYQLRLDHE